MERITTEKVMDKLDIFQSRFEKIDKLGRWDLETILADAGTQFTSTDFDVIRSITLGKEQTG